MAGVWSAVYLTEIKHDQSVPLVRHPHVHPYPLPSLSALDSIPALWALRLKELLWGHLVVTVQHYGQAGPGRLPIVT